MKNLRLKKNATYLLYTLLFITIIGTVYLLEVITSPKSFVDDTIYVNEIILDNYEPVVNTNDIITKPYLIENITIAKTFYNYLDSPESQQNSLIYYDGMYLQNTGVDYKSDEVFDIVSILDGEVTKVTENNLLGKIIEITHQNKMISVYQSLGDISVKEGEKVLQGQVIGKSGNANIAKELGNHLHFELIYNGVNVNPEQYYDKQLGEL